MATTLTKLYPTGILQSSVAFDEVTYNSVKVSTTGVYAAFFDEVTQPPIKNLLIYTEQFNQTYYDKTRTNIGGVNVTLAPNNTLTGEKLIEDLTANSTHYLNAPGLGSYVTSSVLPTASVYVKAGERTVCKLQMILNEGGGFASDALVVDLTNGSILSGTGTVTPAGNGWYRLSLTATTSGTNYAFRLQIYQSSGVSTYSGDGSSGIYIWGGQIESSTSLTPYQGISSAGTIVTQDFAERRTSTGTYMVSGYFDEYTYSVAPF